MRLHWFIPMVRSTKPGKVRPPAGLIVRAVTAFIPARFLTNPANGKRGIFRRFLKWLGPSWASSPLRRVIQGICLITFLALFCYVCFPYTAKPAQPWHGLTPTQVLDNGAMTLAAPAALTPAIRAGQVLKLTDDPDAKERGKQPADFGSFNVTSVTGNQIALQPVKPLSQDQIQQLQFSTRCALQVEWPSHYSENLKAKEKIPARSFLALDPLVSISTAVAGRAWVWTLIWAGILLAVCVFIPRGFCGYICPLGTLIDLFDWLIGKRVARFRVADEGWWVHIKYYMLLGTMIAAMFGVLISGFVSAIPVVTRGLLFTVKPIHDGFARGWHNVPPMNLGEAVSIALFFVVLGLGFFKPRFWCKYVCPSGAVFSVGNLFRASERKVESTCINCNKCVEICPFDAIKPDYTTRVSDCTLCQSCGGVCPTDSIKFVGRGNRFSLKIVNDPPTHETALGRRGFLAASVGVATAMAGGVASAAGIKRFGANLDHSSAVLPIRPPGSVPEQQFLDLCIRCGECFRACPNDVLQPLGFQQGFEGLWTPQVKADWAGCEVSCNNCGQVCPTGAILPIPLSIKKSTRIGLAIVNTRTCLPHAQTGECQLCVDECTSAGYNAIEFIGVGTQANPDGTPIEGTTHYAPSVIADRCVGCGLCQSRCFAVNVKDKKVLQASAIIIEAGKGREDRLTLHERAGRTNGH